MQAASPTEVEREIVADIQAFGRRCALPADVRPNLIAFLRQSHGVYSGAQIHRLGGWMRLCELGGMVLGRKSMRWPGADRESEVSPTPRRKSGFKSARRRKSAPEHLLPPPPLPLSSVLADIRSVAVSLRLKPGAAFTYAIYRRSGGLHDYGVIGPLGGWPKLSAAAGVPSRGHRPEPRKQWLKTESTLTQRDLEAALDQALGRTPAPRGMRRIMGRKRGCMQVPQTLQRELPELERGEVIADIRQVSLSLGLLSPRLLSFEAYRNHGGRYTHEQTATLGGFDTLRRAA